MGMSIDYSPSRSEGPSTTLPPALKALAELTKETFGCDFTFMSHEHYWWNVSAESRPFISTLVTANREP